MTGEDWSELVDAAEVNGVISAEEAQLLHTTGNLGEVGRMGTRYPVGQSPISAYSRVRTWQAGGCQPTAPRAPAS